jgi:transposase
VFQSEEAPALRPLPAVPYRHYERKAARVHIDYHVQLLGHFYSVPYRLARERVEIRYSPTVVEIFHDGLRVASHARDDRPGRATTAPEHMPPRHRFTSEWTPERFISWGRSVGSKTEELVVAIMAAKPHPALGFRACLGLMRLARKYGEVRLEAAAARTLLVGGTSYKSVEHILRNSLDRQQLLLSDPAPPPLLHANLRGPAYYTDLSGGES